MEVVRTDKSANQLWKESGTSLSFANWLQREKDKGNFIPNKGVILDTDEFVADSTATIRNVLNLDKPEAVDAKNASTVFGLNKWVLLLSLAIIGGAIGYKIYQKRK
jgi:hypothetical protein